MEKNSSVKNASQKMKISLHEEHSIWGFHLSGGRLTSIFETVFAKVRDASKIRKIILEPMEDTERNHV